jgi:hypothetical protein
MSRTKEGNEYPLYIANKLRGKGYQTIFAPSSNILLDPWDYPARRLQSARAGNDTKERF